MDESNVNSKSINIDGIEMSKLSFYNITHSTARSAPSHQTLNKREQGPFNWTSGLKSKIDGGIYETFNFLIDFHEIKFKYLTSGACFLSFH